MDLDTGSNRAGFGDMVFSSQDLSLFVSVLKVREFQEVNVTAYTE